MTNAMRQLDGLISVLLDGAASIAERDDAAIDLSDFDEALPTLIEAARNPNEHDVIAASLGVAIGEIWERSGNFDLAVVRTLHPQALSELLQKFSE